ncbi:MAG: leucyl/phenylalanyl-tRNA--protein transferase, partial [Chitinophagia bacterium]|nr:leucyl/phenylalanyl-tRNA--protein transferase [Chitinophagia bacterium]
MGIALLDHNLWFPPVDKAMSDGLLAVGGDLRVDRLLLAYRSGIFPWYSEDEIPMWWSPDPRFVLFPGELHISKSMKQVLKSGRFHYSLNTAFEQVIRHCAATPRVGQDGTWIGNDVIDAYLQLHRLGYAQSAECWHSGTLVGGLYGIRMGRLFFGESMFSHESNASKFAFISWVNQLKAEG